MYSGDEDYDRVSIELPLKDLEKLVRRKGSGKLGSGELCSGLLGELLVHLGELMDIFPAACIW
jgi:hypothetical protein